MTHHYKHMFDTRLVFPKDLLVHGQGLRPCSMEGPSQAAPRLGPRAGYGAPSNAPQSEDHSLPLPLPLPLPRPRPGGPLRASSRGPWAPKRPKISPLPGTLMPTQLQLQHMQMRLRLTPPPSPPQQQRQQSSPRLHPSLPPQRPKHLPAEHSVVPLSRPSSASPAPRPPALMDGSLAHHAATHVANLLLQQAARRPPFNLSQQHQPPHVYPPRRTALTRAQLDAHHLPYRTMPYNHIARTTSDPAFAYSYNAALHELPVEGAMHSKEDGALMHGAASDPSRCCPAPPPRDHCGGEFDDGSDGNVKVDGDWYADSYSDPGLQLTQTHSPHRWRLERQLRTEGLGPCSGIENGSFTGIWMSQRPLATSSLGTSLGYPGVTPAHITRMAAAAAAPLSPRRALEEAASAGVDTEVVGLHSAVPPNHVVRGRSRPPVPQAPLRLRDLRQVRPMAAAMTPRPAVGSNILGDDIASTADGFSERQYDSVRYLNVDYDRGMGHGGRYGLAGYRGGSKAVHQTLPTDFDREEPQDDLRVRSTAQYGTNVSSPLHDTGLNGSPGSAAGMVYDHPPHLHWQPAHPKGVSCGAVSPPAALLIRKRPSATAGLSNPREFACNTGRKGRMEGSPDRPETTGATKAGLCHNAGSSSDVSATRCTVQRPDDHGTAAAAAACPGASATTAATVVTVAMASTNACNDRNESSSALMGLLPQRDPQSTIGFLPTPINGPAAVAATAFGSNTSLADYAAAAAADANGAGARLAEPTPLGISIPMRPRRTIAAPGLLSTAKVDAALTAGVAAPDTPSSTRYAGSGNIRGPGAAAAAAVTAADSAPDVSDGSLDGGSAPPDQFRTNLPAAVTAAEIKPGIDSRPSTTGAGAQPFKTSSQAESPVASSPSAYVRGLDSGPGTDAVGIHPMADDVDAGMQLLAERFRTRPGRVPKAMAQLGPIAAFARDAATGRVQLGRTELHQLVACVETKLAEVVSEQKEGNRVRNRMAQRMHRNRQRERIQQLESKVSGHKLMIGQLVYAVQAYQAQLRKLCEQEGRIWNDSPGLQTLLAAAQAQLQQAPCPPGRGKWVQAQTLQQQQQLTTKTHEQPLQLEGWPQQPHEPQQQEDIPPTQQQQEEHGCADEQGLPLPYTKQRHQHE
ncbi:hypothetical protein VaNZ11_014945 [Volvox africanus]|uniref:BZIP domain-containing protein n=1 Tax=Volvox africanus TaxID=51714 RepID=A0ABQ5SJH1_9CHLO|nr:hypothetical protein VaNZ11_014945 [Volvox africanus]